MDIIYFFFSPLPHLLVISLLYIFSLATPLYYHCITSSLISLSLFSPFGFAPSLACKFAQGEGGGVRWCRSGQRWMEEAMIPRPPLSISTSPCCGLRQIKEQASIVNLDGDPPPHRRCMQRSSFFISLCYGSRQMKEQSRMVNLCGTLSLHCRGMPPSSFSTLCYGSGEHGESRWRQMKEHASIVNLGEDPPPHHWGMLASGLSPPCCVVG